MIYDNLSVYYGMSREEFIRLIDDDIEKLCRFILDFTDNNNQWVKIK